MDAPSVINENSEKAEPGIIGVRFQKIGKMYHFDSGGFPVAEEEYVVVETSRGRQLGKVIQRIEKLETIPGGGLKTILRVANAQDLVLRQVWQQKEAEAIVQCREKAAEIGVVDVKFVAAEFSFDGARLTILYSHETDERFEFKNLRRSMSRVYPQSQIEFHLIGPRDVAKLLGGMGACGIDSRCCAMFITEFSPISIKMAKEQGISLTPTEITGMCGRLRCCLLYEYETYVEARKLLPKRGKMVGTPKGEAKVVDVLTMKEAVMVEFTTGGRAEFTKDELIPLEALEVLKQKVESVNGTEPVEAPPAVKPPQKEVRRDRRR